MFAFTFVFSTPLEIIIPVATEGCTKRYSCFQWIVTNVAELLK